MSSNAIVTLIESWRSTAHNLEAEALEEPDPRRIQLISMAKTLECCAEDLRDRLDERRRSTSDHLA